MKYSSARTSLLLVMAVCVLLFGGIATQAQDNLLDNPGFEGTFTTVAGGTVAASWTPWHVPRTGDMPTFQNAQPIYVSSADAAILGITPRVRSGNNAQIYYSFFETHDGGIYQQIQGVESGREYRFSIYAHVWSSTFEDPELSEDPGDVSLRVGIDPNGGTNALSSSVEYSTAAVFYDTYRQYSVIATAESSTITVFIRSTVGLPVQNTYIYLDDAVLEATDDEPIETEEPTDEPVETEEPTDEPVETEEPTDEPVETEEPTEDPVGQEPTPTQEELPTLVATATQPQLLPTSTSTPIIIVPTPTPDDTLLNDFPFRIVHTVQRGDTVSRLAAQYNSSIDAVIQANGLNSNGLIFVGQALLIPVRSTTGVVIPTATLPPVFVVTATPTPVIPNNVPTTGTTYSVQPGDTLAAVARRFNTTVGALVTLNNIANPNRILVGQTLNVPSANVPVPAPTATSIPVVTATPVSVSPGQIPTLLPTFTPAFNAQPQPQPPVVGGETTYVVQPGDNLYRVALRFNVSLLRLAEANGITNYNFVFVGQRLTIP